MNEERFPPGKYYVGDLCYVLSEKNGYDWDHLLAQTNCLQLDERHPRSDKGVFEYHGTTFFSSRTAWGDGRFWDGEGRWYGVDAGLIGCFPVGALGDKPAIYGGHVVEFSQEFLCSVCDEDGDIHIGHLSIKTDP